MANLKNTLMKSLGNSSNFDNALQCISNAQDNLLKNYSNPVFNFEDRNKLLNSYSMLNDLGKSFYRCKTLSDNNMNISNESENASNVILKGGISNIKYIWHSENGENTCEKCKALDGSVYDFEDEVPQRPHPNCKCTVEVVEDASQSENDGEPCDCYGQMDLILEQTDELEVKLQADVDEIISMTDQAEADYQEFEQLYSAVQALANEVENMESNGSITGFAASVSENSGLKDIVLELLRTRKTSSEALALFEYNKRLMAEERKHSDKYYHAKANCDAASLGVLQALWAEILSIAKEVDDYKYKVKDQHRNFIVIFIDCMEDLKADFYGLLKARNRGYCSEEVLPVEDFPTIPAEEILRKIKNRKYY